jgi:monothiol glutaredoxin
LPARALYLSPPSCASKWPTIPQVFLNGEFIGGADILLALYQSGELADLLEGGGAKSKK